MRAEPHLVLVGMMGSGKTAVGRECARRLARTFVDTDELVEAAAGVSISRIFEEQGERAFRDLERGAVADAVATPQPAVISCGGGAVVDAENRRVLTRSGFVVWLTAPPEVLAERVGRGDGRPLLATGQPAADLERLARIREPSYVEVADAAVDTTSMTVGEVAADVARLYEERGAA